LKITPVILSGGFGKRLWPLSRNQYPKQYLSLVGKKSMLQETILRLDGLKGLEKPIIMCNADHRFLAAEQCQQIGVKNAIILLEPVGKNTAPAIAAAALQSIREFGDTLLLVLPADHHIEDIDALHRAIDVATKQALSRRLVTFGIVPTDANTGYGYIEYSKERSDNAYRVKSFVEKPDQETANQYLKKGDHLWNSGMFMFRASVVIDELTTYAPNIVRSVTKSLDKATQDFDFVRLGEQDFSSSPSDSIDYALMEKSDKCIVVPLDANWNDLGSFSSLYNVSTKDKNGNVIKGDVLHEKTKNSYISASNRLVATLGVENVMIIDSPDALLVASRDESQNLTNIVEKLEIQNREEQVHNRKVYRPWGWYDSIDSGDNFQVKRLHVKPKGKLSLQMHQQRAEFWVVISGEATVTLEEKTITLKAGQSTFIPIKTKHSIANLSNIELEVIEVQSGAYLGEDDIIRFEDVYGRMKQ
jgi:mannose-1-phosphate guanylyltransferase/mannose-6-phosphate isomerase